MDIESIKEENMKDKTFLMIPGPTPVPETVMTEMAKHPIGHRSSEFSSVLEEVYAGLKYVFQTENDVFVYTASGTGAMCGALENLVNEGDKVLCLSLGNFGNRWAKIAEAIGADVEKIEVGSGEVIDPEVLRKRLAEDTNKEIKIVTMTHSETSTGAVNDIKAITKRVKEINPNVFVHSDGVQAVGKLNINLADLGVDYYTMSAHKINGPKGVAALYIGKPNRFKPFICGGGQEMNLRSGTENLPGILAFKQAVEDLVLHNYAEYKQAILQNIKQEHILVSTNKSVDNIISICFKGVRGETILHMLESLGFMIGTGSACNSKAGLNRVLAPIVPKDYIEGAIRLSFGDDVTLKDCLNLGLAIDNAVAEYKARIKR